MSSYPFNPNAHQQQPLRFYGRPSNTSSIPPVRDSYTSTYSRPHNPVITQAAPLNQTYVSAAPSGPLTKSTIVVDDEERYRKVAGEMNGYGRNKEGSWLGNNLHTYNKRTDKRLHASIVDAKSNADEYRYDPYCTLI